MTVFPNDFFSTNRINSDTALVLDIKMPYLSRLGLVNKSTFGFMDRLWIWLGMHTTCIEKISNLFAANVTHLRNPKKYSRSFLNKISKVEKGVPGAERIEALAKNLITFNLQIDTHNKSLSWKTPFRKTAVKVNQQFIEALLSKAKILRIPPPPIVKIEPVIPLPIDKPIPPTPVLHRPNPSPELHRSNPCERITNWFLKIPTRLFSTSKNKVEESNNPATEDPTTKSVLLQKTLTIVSVEAPVVTIAPVLKDTTVLCAPNSIPDYSAYAAPNTNPPSKLPHFGLTCHFASAINFLASLPPLIDIFYKADVDQTSKDFQKALIPTLINQGTSSQDVSLADFVKLGELSRIKDIRNNQSPIHDVDLILNHFVEEGKTSPEILQRMRSTVTTNIIFGHSHFGRKENYKFEEMDFSPNFPEIDLSESELRQFQPFIIKETAPHFNFNLMLTPANFSIIRNVVNGENVTKYVCDQKFSSLNQCLDYHFMDKWVNSTDLKLIRTKETATEPSKAFLIEGISFLSNITITNTPEVLMVEIGRLNTAGEFNHAIAIPEELQIAGQKYALCSGIKVLNGHCVAMQNRRGKWFLNDDRGGVSTPDIKPYLDQGSLFGYVRKDVHEKMLS